MTNEEQGEAGRGRETDADVDAAMGRQAPAAGPTLEKRVVRGFAWMMAQSLGAKSVYMAGQIALAWLLLPRDFGLLGLSLTFTSFATILQQAGLRETLIQRQRRFERWAGSAFWMSLALGGMAALALLAAAPFAARIYRDPQISGMISILALASLLSAFSVVPSARLERDLRFGTLAVVALADTLLTMSLAVACAWMKLGAYSFVLPQPIAAAVRAGVLWRLGGPLRPGRPRLRRWRLVWRDSRRVLGANLLYMMIGQGDYMVLGLFFSAHTVGLYFFAFYLSIQSVVLFTSQLSNILFPILSRLQGEPRRQTQAFLRACQSPLVAMLRRLCRVWRSLGAERACSMALRNSGVRLGVVHSTACSSLKAHTAGRLVETTGLPAAKYSLILVGTTVSVYRLLT